MGYNKYDKMNLDFTTELDILRIIAKKYEVLKDLYLMTLDNYDGWRTREDLDKRLERELKEAIK